MYNGNPFAKPAPAYYGVAYTETVTADDRIRLVRGFTAAECEAALAMKLLLQITVLKEVERRLRKLTRPQIANRKPRHRMSGKS